MLKGNLCIEGWVALARMEKALFIKIQIRLEAFSSVDDDVVLRGLIN